MISIYQNVRKSLAGGCFFLGSIWAAAGAFKLIFGVRITYPLLPPIGLERVNPLSALVVALGFCILGAWLERSSRESALERSDLDAGESRYDLPYGADEMPSVTSARRSTASSRNRLTQ